MTKEQIENWRKILCLQLGSHALTMPAEEIQKLKDKMQSRVDGLSEKGEV